MYRCGFAGEKKKHKLVTPNFKEISFDSKKDALTHQASLENEAGASDYEYCVDREIPPLSHILQNVRTTVDTLEERLGCPMEFVLTGTNNFREGLATLQKYKGNRPEDGKPYWYKEIREYFQERHFADVIDGQEADDEIGIRATAYRADGLDPIIVSIDKDLKQIPSLHYDWVKDVYSEVDEVSGRRKFYQQLLVGDSTDNIPGLYRVGEVKADKALAPFSKESGMFQTVRKMYHDHYGSRYTVGDKSLPTDEAILEIGRLLYIRKYKDEMWNFPN